MSIHSLLVLTLTGLSLVLPTRALELTVEAVPDGEGRQLSWVTGLLQNSSDLSTWSNIPDAKSPYKIGSSPEDSQFYRLFSTLDPDVDDFVSRASISSPVIQQEMVTFVKEVKTRFPKLWSRLTLIPCTKHGRLYPIGGGVKTFPSKGAAFVAQGTTANLDEGIRIGHGSVPFRDNRIIMPLSHKYEDYRSMEPWFMGVIFSNDNAPAGIGYSPNAFASNKFQIGGHVIRGGTGFANSNRAFLYGSSGVHSTSTYGLYGRGMGFDGLAFHDHYAINTSNSELPTLIGAETKTGSTKITSVINESIFTHPNPLGAWTNNRSEGEGLSFYPNLPNSTAGNPTGVVHAIVFIEAGIGDLKLEMQEFRSLFIRHFMPDKLFNKKVLCIAQGGQSLSEIESFRSMINEFQIRGYSIIPVLLADEGGEALVSWVGGKDAVPATATEPASPAEDPSRVLIDPSNPTEVGNYVRSFYKGDGSAVMEQQFLKASQNTVRVVNFIQGESDTQSIAGAEKWLIRARALRKFTREDLGDDIIFGFGVSDYTPEFRTGVAFDGVNGAAPVTWAVADFTITYVKPAPDPNAAPVPVVLEAGEGDYLSERVTGVYDSSDGHVTNADKIYKWTMTGGYTLEKVGSQWELKDSSNVILAKSTGPEEFHPSLVSGWSSSYKSLLISETRTAGIEMLRKNQKKIADEDPKSFYYDTRKVPRNLNDHVHPTYTQGKHMQGKIFAEKLMEYLNANK